MRRSLRGMFMSRVDLRVPIYEKEAAKRLGARWDPKQKTWYVPDGIDPAAFGPWLVQSAIPNIRAPSWFLVRSRRACWSCGVDSYVFAIVLPAGYETFVAEDDPADDYWERGEEASLLRYIDDVAPSVAAQLQRLAPRYRVDYSQTTHSFYRMNHCEHCEAKLGDFETIEEPGTFHEAGAGFDPGMSGIELQEIAEPFTGSCAAA